MARWQPLPFVGGAYRDESRPWSAQDCVNYLPVPAEASGTRSAYKLVGVPGLNPFSKGMQEAPVRGMHDVEGLLLAVTGNTLYKVRPTGVVIPIGTIPGNGRVDIAHNQIKNGYEVAIGNNQSGYVYNTVTDTLTQITDDGFPGARSNDYVDGYIAAIEPQGRFWFHSDLRQATQYNTLDRYDAESAPDKLLSLVVSHREVMILGARTGAFFRNTGATTGTFQNANGMEIEVGVANPYCAARLDNTVYWLGNDGLVYRLEGHTPVIVSTGPIADAMAEWDLSTAFCMTWEDMKHKVIYFTFPTGQTFGYDAWTQEWHRRQSYGLDRWRVSAICKSGGIWYAGDYTNGRLYTLDWLLQAEADQPLVRRRVTGAIHADQNDVVVKGVELVLDTGKPTVLPSDFPEQPAGPSISGEAPDGLTNEAYSFAYTTVAGDAPIQRTVLRDTVLPDGWAWNESTATISYGETPVPAGLVTLKMRVYDTNGLYADHEDTFLISLHVQLLVTGSAKTTGGPVFAVATATSSPVFTGLPQSSGADIDLMTATYHDGAWVAIHKDGVRYAEGSAETWLTGTIDEYPDGAENFGQVVGGPDGFLSVIPSSSSFSPTAYLGTGDPLDFARTTLSSEMSNGTDGQAHNAAYIIAASDGYLLSGKNRALYYSATLSGEYVAQWDFTKETAAGRSSFGASIMYWYDLVQCGDDWYAVILWDFRTDLQRRLLIKNSSGPYSWATFDVVLDDDFDEGASNKPAQLCVGVEYIVCYNTDGTIWTNANDWAEPIATGLSGPGGDDYYIGLRGGRRIVYADPLFYLIGSNDKLVTFDPVTLEVSEPVTLPISNAISLSAAVIE